MIPICLAFFFSVSSAQADWDYEVGVPTGPENWHINYPTCGGTAQSPINIKTDLLQFQKQSLTINLQASDVLHMVTDGHALVCTPNNLADLSSVVHHADRSTALYHVQSFHFYWGTDSTHGSEHVKDGEAYPMEMQIVHTKDGSDTGADLLVLGLFFEIANDDNPVLQPLVDRLIEINSTNTSVTVATPGVHLADLIPSSFSSDYTYYHGSLTTPPCDETVSWKHATENGKISERQLEQFRRLLYLDYEGLAEDFVHNYRPVQPIHDRSIHRSKQSDDRIEEEEFFAAIISIPIVFTVFLLVKLKRKIDSDDASVSTGPARHHILRQDDEDELIQGTGQNVELSDQDFELGDDMGNI